MSGSNMETDTHFNFAKRLGRNSKKTKEIYDARLSDLTKKLIQKIEDILEQHSQTEITTLKEINITKELQPAGLWYDLVVSLYQNIPLSKYDINKIARNLLSTFSDPSKYGLDVRIYGEIDPKHEDYFVKLKFDWST